MLTSFGQRLSTSEMTAAPYSGISQSLLCSKKSPVFDAILVVPVLLGVGRSFFEHTSRQPCCTCGSEVPKRPHMACLGFLLDNYRLRSRLPKFFWDSV